jgi:hypothetical protein
MRAEHTRAAASHPVVQAETGQACEKQSVVARVSAAAAAAHFVGKSKHPCSTLRVNASDCRHPCSTLRVNASDCRHPCSTLRVNASDCRHPCSFVLLCDRIGSENNRLLVLEGAGTVGCLEVSV